MRLNSIRSVAIYGLYLIGASASPVKRSDDDSDDEGKQNSETLFESASGVDSHFYKPESLFDGSLGTLPAIWLVSQGALAAFVSANSTHNVRRQEDQGRTELENGGVMAAFVGLMLTFPVKVYDENVYHALCETILGGASGMGGTVVSQESGKAIYEGNSTSNDFEQGVVPGGFIGGAFNAVVGTTLSKTICKHLKNEEEKPDGPGGIPKRRSFDDLKDLVKTQGFLSDLPCMLIDSALSMTVPQLARRLHLGQQIRDLFRLAEQYGMHNTVQQLNMETIRQMRELANLAADKFALGAAGSALASLALMAKETSFILGTDARTWDTPLYPDLGHLATIADHLSATIEFAATVPELAAIAQGMRPELQLLHEEVSKHMKKAEAEQAKLDEENRKGYEGCKRTHCEALFPTAAPESPAGEAPGGGGVGGGPGGVVPVPVPTPEAVRPPPPPPEPVCEIIWACTPFPICYPVKQC